MFFDSLHKNMAFLPEVSAEIAQIAVNKEFIVVLLKNGHAGLFYTPNFSKEDHERLKSMCKSLIGKRAYEKAGILLQEKDAFSKSLGLASLSALSQPYLNTEFLSSQGIDMQLKEFGFIPKIEIRTYSTVAYLGFSSYVQDAAKKATKNYIITLEEENNFSWLINESAGPIKRSEALEICYDDCLEVLEQVDFILAADHVIGTPLFEKIMQHKNKQTKAILFGSGLSLYPGYMRDYEIYLVSTIRVNDGPGLLNLIHNTPNYSVKYINTFVENVVISRF